MQKRPYFSSTVEELEKVFESSRNDLKTLKVLHHELQLRSTDRAKKLQAKVEKILPNNETGGVKSARQSLSGDVQGKQSDTAAPTRAGQGSVPPGPGTENSTMPKSNDSAHEMSTSRPGRSNNQPDDARLEIEETDDGTEYEDTGITRPFNPTLINILTKQMSLDTLIRRMREGEVDLSPDFQRAEVWKPTARSRLIESLLIRIPLPAFYMDATNEDRWLVVDGLQRLSTIRDFVIKKTMQLQDLEFLTQFHGRTYDNLPRNYQRRIEETQVTVYQIEKGTPAEVKFNIFKRINTGGLPLSAQEIRHALNQGAVTLYLKQLADSKSFQRATDGGISDKRMAARECVLRFLAFTITPPEVYKATDFDAFLSNTMDSLNRMSDKERTELADRFIRSVDASYEIFGEAAFRKPKGRNRSPVNKALFEVWTVTMDKLTDKELRVLRDSRTEVGETVDEFMRNDRDFLNAVSQGTGDTAKVRLRFDRFRKVIQGALS